MKSEEKSIQAISAQAHSEAADNRLLRKKLQARDRRVVELEAMVSNLNKQLCEKVDQLNDMMQKLVAFMTGNGEVNLSDSLREAVVAGVRAEFEAREQNPRLPRQHPQQVWAWQGRHYGQPEGLDRLTLFLHIITIITAFLRLHSCIVQEISLSLYFRVYLLNN